MRAAVSLAFLLTMACSHEAAPGDPQVRARLAMVDRQIAARGVKDERVLEAMRRIPRHRFVPDDHAALAYEDHPVPIGYEQTISQPYIVAYMTEQLHLEATDRVLEIGTGSGYQAAVLAELAEEVYSIEIVEPLAQRSTATLRALGYTNVRVRAGDGYRGWPEAAPFDAIIVTAAPDHVPPKLVEQLAVGGRLVIPVGRNYQDMTVITKTSGGVIEEQTIAVRFVPMTGEAEKRKE
ncbi:MAG: protein-L-isoaspartate(D-aspartate) O-methyltransferase [Thermoanaerobaculia bacterium]